MIQRFLLIILISGIQFTSTLPNMRCPASFATATSTCTLASVDEISNARKADVGIWLPLRKVDFHEWRTVHGDFYAPEIIPEGRRIKGQDCAVLRSEDMFVDEAFCGNKTLGYACHKTSERCMHDGECVSILGYNITFFCEELTWFEAHSKCISKGGQLLALEQREMTKIAKNVRRSLKTQGEFAVGILRSAWMYLYVKKLLDHYNWTEKEPSPRKQCAVVRKSTGFWLGVNCEENHYYLCDPEGSADDMRKWPVGNWTITPANTTSKPIKEKQHELNISCKQSHDKRDDLQHPLYWIIGLLAMLVLLFIVFMICFLAIHLKRQKNSPSVGIKEEENHQSETFIDHQSSDMPEKNSPSEGIKEEENHQNETFIDHQSSDMPEAVEEDHEERNLMTKMYTKNDK